jgi:hypothetical protein
MQPSAQALAREEFLLRLRGVIGGFEFSGDLIKTATDDRVIGDRPLRPNPQRGQPGRVAGGMGPRPQPRIMGQSRSE